MDFGLLGTIAFVVLNAVSVVTGLATIAEGVAAGKQHSCRSTTPSGSRSRPNASS
jgi:hypothetical protein